MTGTFWISGGTGTLGTALTHNLLAQGFKVRTFSRNQHNIEALQKGINPEFLPRLSCHEGSVEDPERLLRSMRGADYVIHAAAAKIVHQCEYNPHTAISTNVLGSINVVNACLDAGVKKAVLVSTDKASAPVTLYGASKLCAERVFLNGNRYSAGHGCEFSAVRYGNVYASQGSVLHAWKDAASRGNPLKLTDPSCTRFHLHRHEAVAFVLDALEHAHPGELWIPKLPTYRIGNLCMAFRRVFGITSQPEIVGLRLAEKLHEDLISPHESIACKAKLEHHYVLEPGRIHEQGGWGYSSGMPGHQLSVEELIREVETWANAQRAGA